MQKCQDMVLSCQWNGKAVKCGDLFAVRRTDGGFCCSFNTVRMAEQL